MCGTFPRDLRPQARPDLVAAADAAAFMMSQQPQVGVPQPMPEPQMKEFNFFDAATWEVLDQELDYSNSLVGFGAAPTKTVMPIPALSFPEPLCQIEPICEELPFQHQQGPSGSHEATECKHDHEVGSEEQEGSSEHMTEEDRIFNAARLGPLFQGESAHQEPTAEELKTHPCFATLKSAGVRIKGRSRIELVQVAERIRKRRRESAARSRARKANKLTTLSAENQALRQENMALRHRLQELTRPISMPYQMF
eukprot:CAMPEP_0177768040 /NCGR_PEP_ID=MMETSP0491_2-20121128/9494_1 /TAXON_ID=63592 /ORGANISM="Tetraselmis chuii, Strain PLY429" /LENGTH=252 /DNA_ID=CAMNT_0019284791 /DNA_START=265 /DNA_END=1023 /DNA_ORIENTATION=+